MDCLVQQTSHDQFVHERRRSRQAEENRRCDRGESVGSDWLRATSSLSGKSPWLLSGLRRNGCDTIPARRPSAGGVPGRKGLAWQQAPFKIRVNAIAPAVVETPLFDPLMSSEQLASFNKFHPLGRNGQARDITEAVLFLADDEKSGWITGVVLPVDGGVTAGRN